MELNVNVQVVTSIKLLRYYFIIAHYIHGCVQREVITGKYFHSGKKTLVFLVKSEYQLLRPVIVPWYQYLFQVKELIKLIVEIIKPTNK